MIKINLRSPYFLNTTDPNLDSSILSLYIYTGEYVTDKPASAQYTIEKNVVGTNTYNVYEISELVRDYLDVEFNQEYTEDLYKERVLNDHGTFEGSSCLSDVLNQLDDDYLSQTVWVEADIFNYDSAGNTIGSETYDFIAFDGYSYFEDGANAELSRTLLQSNTDMYIKSGERIQIPVYTEEVTSVQFYNGLVLEETVSVSSSNNTNAQIKYVSTTSIDVDNIKVLSSEGTETINVYQTDECKYTPYQVTFVNRFGALQNIWFFKKSMENLNTKTETYKANTLDQLSITYDLQKHQYKQFQKAGRENITMNTGYVSEQYNEVIKELLLSEQVWFTKQINGTSTVLPINVKTQSLQYKTSVNDKLINYTIDFDYAYDKINNIR